MHSAVDVLIAGGGPVGAFLALCLRDSPLSVLHVDSNAPSAKRPIALSYGSRLLLERHNVFARIDNTSIQTIHVSQRGGFGRVLMTAKEHGLPALGYVAEYGAIRAAISDSAKPTLGEVTGWAAQQGAVSVKVQSAEAGTDEYRARLLVLADGLSETTRNTHAVSVSRDYQQCAIVAQVRTQIPHRNIAYERFTDQGPLALLPNGEGYALVWCVNPSAAPSLVAMPKEEFLAQLGAGFGSRVGPFVAIDERQQFPLSLRYVKQFTDPGIVAIGNAAQALHPVAGQGLNLGLRDAWELATALKVPNNFNGQADFAARFMQQRRADRRIEIGLTDALVRIFSRRDPVLGVLRGAALFAIDTLPAARRLVARTMMFGLR
ncbi:MAG: FAD-dependent monooxygenase [Burkholderiales bacterium]